MYGPCLFLILIEVASVIFVDLNDPRARVFSAFFLLAFFSNVITLLADPTSLPTICVCTTFEVSGSTLYLLQEYLAH